MKFKSEAFSIFCAFHKMVENLLNTKITFFHSDGGKEYDNTSFLEYLVAHGIYFRKSAPHTQQQNGVAERKHRHIVEMARTFLVLMPLYLMSFGMMLFLLLLM